MKKTMLVNLLLLSILSYSQKPPEYDEVKLENAADYKAADSLARKAAVFLLSMPIKKEKPEWKQSLSFLIRWMAGTPDYSFSPAADILKDNEELVDLYMACLARFCLENKALSKNKKTVKKNAVKLLLDYCRNPANKIKMAGRLKELNEADRKGTLDGVL